ncbi:MAG TPA: hypothetical protein VHM48_06185, partial [Candidatus Limnocylindrales bacterium]|nr:hypothetical protein [Candidatus Limnocylindrales bacterium]
MVGNRRSSSSGRAAVLALAFALVASAVGMTGPAGPALVTAAGPPRTPGPAHLRPEPGKKGHIN